jgi:hypothetical protein
VPAGDGTALTEAIRGYLSAPERAREAGGRAVDHVRAGFALDGEAMALIEVYEALGRSEGNGKGRA